MPQRNKKKVKSCACAMCRIASRDLIWSVYSRLPIYETACHMAENPSAVLTTSNLPSAMWCKYEIAMPQRHMETWKSSSTHS